MKTFRFLPLALLLALLLLAAGCGGGSKSVPPTAVAVVGSQTITKTEFNSLFDSARSQYQAKKTPFPKPGTTQYKQLQDRALGYLVEISEFEQKAKDLGITITPKDVNARLALIKKQVGGTDKAYRAQLKASGITEKQLLQNIHANLLSEKLYAKVTAKTTVSNDEIKTYYAAHKSAYGHAASRDIRHILVNSEKLAKDIIQQLKGGADFAKLAKKYSKDPGSAANGGKLTITKGQTVAEFDKTAFALQTNQLSGPVKTTYGWHVIQALSDVRPASVTSLAGATDQIRKLLLTTKKTAQMQTWLADVKKSYVKKIRYQAGYVPEPTATVTSTVPTQTTTG